MGVIYDEALKELERRRDRYQRSTLDSDDRLFCSIQQSKADGLSQAIAVVMRYFGDPDETVTCRCRYSVSTGERFQAYGECKVHPVEVTEGREAFSEKGLDSTSELG